MRAILGCISLLLYLCSSLAFARADEVVLATVPWEPFFSPKLPDGGYISDLAIQSFAAVGIKAQVKFMPWKRALALVKSGKYDGVLGAYYSEERTKNYIFSEPIGYSVITLFHYSDKPFSYTGASSLKGMAVGVMDGFHYSNEFDNSELFMRYPARTNKQLFDLLISKRVDFIAENKEVVYYKLRTQYPEIKDKIKHVENPINVTELYVMFSKNNKNIENINQKFNKGFEIIKASGVVDKLKQKHGFLVVNDR